MDEDMNIWTGTWKRGRGHGNMDKDMETWTMETWTRTWKHGQGHGNMDDGNMDEDCKSWLFAP